jgi:intracellular sulfur oxidation DsrE/DsrF family protein
MLAVHETHERGVNATASNNSVSVGGRSGASLVDGIVRFIHAEVRVVIGRKREGFALQL